MNALGFIKDSLFAEESALRDGLLQSIDPRVKVLTFLIFLLLVIYLKSVILVISLYAFCLLLAKLSKIPLKYFFARTWFFIPLFSLFIALPALFSFCTPGQTLCSFKAGGIAFVITRQGVRGGLIFVARVITSVSFVILLTLTTRHFVLLRVLRIFKIPAIFVMILEMCHRYLFIFADLIERTYLAIKSRGGELVSQTEGPRIVAWNLAHLWKRSSVLNEQVYHAMLARGYEGEPVTMNRFRLKFRDGLWSCAVLSLTLVFLWLNICPFR